MTATIIPFPQSLQPPLPTIEGNVDYRQMRDELLRIGDFIHHRADLLAQRLHNNTAASPSDAGGDLDATWEDVNQSGSETFVGDNPTPDQSMVEENAKAMGVSLEDNEELDFLGKLERRDRDRYELEEQSKTRDDTI